MKKLILVIAIAFFGVSTLSAQEYVVFGAKGGLNFTNMTSDGFEENNSMTGFHLGVLAEIPVSDMFSLQPEVLYSTQGTDASSSFNGNNINGEYRLDYIQVPIIAKFYLLGGLAVEVGPSFNFLVNEEVNIGSVTSDTEFGSTFEFGGAFGASYKLPGGIFASARYTRGFTDAFNSDNWDEDAVNNNGFQIGVGWLF